MDVTEGISIDVGHLKPGDLWKMKDEIAKAEWNSRKIWDSMGDNRRAALVLMVREALLKLIEDPNGWLPTSMEPNSGDQLDLKISIRLPVLNAEELNRYVDLERTRNQAGLDLLAALQKLRH